ncbi:MAG: DUF1819 family protein [Candidatus Eremiobacterota bacterium]
MTPITLEYSASLTGDPLLYFEMRETAALILEGLSEDKIKEKIYGENIFQYDTKNRIYRRIASLKKRLSLLDEYLLNMLVNGMSETGKIITLWTIYKTSRLFYEFMEEVVKEKFISGQDYLEYMDFSLFFQRKADEDETVAAWQESTVKKLQSVIKKILSETEILKRDKSLQRKILHPDLRAHLLDKGERQFLACIEGNF